jgi:hypothetical protein
MDNENNDIHMVCHFVVTWTQLALTKAYIAVWEAFRENLSLIPQRPS